MGESSSIMLEKDYLKLNVSVESLERDLAEERLL